MAIWSSPRARRRHGEDAEQRLIGWGSLGWHIDVGAARTVAVNGGEGVVVAGGVGDGALQLGGVEGTETLPSI
jgi:hypothetical protein